MSRIGIDFGTTNSYCAFYSKEGDNGLMNIMKSNKPEPSLFFFKQNIGELYGEKCNDYISTLPNYVIKSIKGMLEGDKFINIDGKSFEKTYIVRKYIEYLINNVANIKLESMYEDAVDEVVLSFPVGFSEDYKTKIKKAVEEIYVKNSTVYKIKVIAMIEEPVAAAIHYFYIMQEKNIKVSDNVLVYDLGGGTFDVAIVHRDTDSNMLKVVDHMGKKKLGGDQWDQLLAEYVLKRLESECLAEDQKKEVQSIKEESREYSKFLIKIENLKKRLSDDEEIVLSLECGYSLKINRTEFESITKYLMDETIDICKKIIQNNADCEINQLILCGGSTYMPMVKEQLSKNFPGMKMNLHYPESSVAFGDILYKEDNNITTVLKTNHSYGTNLFIQELGINKIKNVIYFNETLPLEKKDIYFTNQDGDYVSYKIYEGDVREDGEVYSDLNSQKLLKAFIFKFKYSVPMGTKMNVVYTLDEMGLLSLEVHSDHHDDQRFEIKVFNYD
ncbi:Hsp70 family protein [[Eubacterium] hominis]|uniref:Hsp70 family protein n=1 Tax=[Eubacterium] hominis TaxID=2764325 RepID=UPI003A4DE170